MANNNTYTIRVRATDGGDIQKLEQALADLGATVTRTRRASTDAARAATDSVRVQNQGIIGTANSTRSFSKLAETIGGNSSGLVGAYATLAANIFAVTAAFNALRSASQVEQIFRGLEASGVRTGQSLTSTAKALRDVTGAAISTEQALRATAQITSAGFGQDAVERLGKAARDTSFALGRNMTDSLERLSRGVVKLEPELLDELGIMTKIGESNAMYALQLGKTESQLTNFEKRQGFLNAVLAEAELKFGGLSESAGDSTAYDKLSATFNDLTNSTLNLANVFAKPLANALSENNTLLLGLTVAFGATLRSQLIPGLVNVSAKSQAAAAQLKELAKEKLAGVEAARALARAENDQALASQKNFAFVQRLPAKYAAVADAVRDGTASADQQRIALTSLNRSLNANNQILANNANFAAETAKGDAKRAENVAIQQEIAAIERLQQAQAKANNLDVEGTQRVAAARNAARVAGREALAQTAANAAVGAASQLKLNESWKQLTLSVRAYGSAQALASAEGVTAMTRLRIAAFATSAAVKTIGVAFLAALPWIGAIITAAGLLSSAIDSFKSDRTKRIAEDFDALAEVTAKTNKYLAEIKRANESTAPAALRAAQAITIQSNAITETNEKLNELLLTANTANNDNGFVKLARSIKNLFTLDVAELDFKGNFNPETPAVAKLRSAFNELVWDTGPRNDKATQGAQEALQAMSKFAPEATDRIVKLRGGWKQLQSITDPATYQRNVQAIANSVQKEFDGAADAVKSTQESFKALDESLARFTTGSVISTSFDEVVKNFDATRDSVRALRETVGTFDSGALEKLMTGIGPNTGQYLDAATEKALANYREQDAIAQQLLKQGDNLTAKEKSRLEYALKQTAQGRELYFRIVDQVDQTSKLFETSQKMERTYKSQLELLNAHIAANQGIYAAAGAGVRARIAQEEKVRGLQAAQIKLQIDLNHAAYDRQRLRIEELKSMNTMSVYQAEQLKNEIALSKAAQERALAQKGVSLAAVQNSGYRGQSYLTEFGDSTENRKTAAMIDSYIVFSRDRVKYGEESVKNAKELEALTRQTRDADAALLNLQNQLKILAEQTLTAEQKRAAIRAADIQYQSGVLNTLNEQRKSLNDVINTYEDVAAVTAGISDNLDYQLRIIRSRAQLEREEVMRRSATNKAAAEQSLVDARALLSRRNLTGLEREAGNVAINNANEQIRLAQQQEAVDLARIDSQEALNVAQKIYFDTAQQGLDWQRTSLDLLQKQVDASRTLSDENTKIYEAQVRLAAKRRGFEVGRQGTEALEIRAASEAYRLAVAESSLKKSLIDLEFALLDAQKDQLENELRARRSSLNENTDQVRIQQIEATLNRLERVDLQSISAASKAAVDRSVEGARVALQSALTPVTTSFFGGLMSAAEGFRQRQQAAANAAQTASSARPINSGQVVGAETQAEKIARAANNPLIESQLELRKKIDEWIKVVGGKIEQFVPTGTGSIQDAARLAESRGFRVSELAGFGGVTPGAHRGRGHGDGRAFDLNIGYGNVEANNPQMRARMDAMADEFRKQGYTVLWKVAGHFNHMHVELGKQAAKAAEANVKVIENIGTRAETEIAQKVDQIETKPVVVSGQKMAANDNAPASPAQIAPEPPVNYYAGATNALIAFDEMTSKTLENLRQLGPQGEVVVALSAGMSQIGQSALGAMNVFKDAKSNFGDRFTAIASAASTALGVVSSALAAGAQAKEEAVQREIDAEQRRDGKSAESLAKIAALEKKKDEIARKQFNTNKKLQMAQAVIATAAGVAQALSLGPIIGPIMAGVIAAMGAAQIAIISGTQYQSTASTANAVGANTPSLTIGKRGDSIDLAKANNNVGGELGYLRGSPGTGTNASNYSVIGSAYGGDLPRGYGNAAYVVGEKGPETIVPTTPISVRPANDNPAGNPVNATINITALDASGVEDVLHNQRGNLISMFREAANANGTPFLEDVNVASYSRPNKTANTRL